MRPLYVLATLALWLCPTCLAAAESFPPGWLPVARLTSESPWELAGVKLQPGLRALYAVGVRADGSRAACRPALVIVR